MSLISANAFNTFLFIFIKLNKIVTKYNDKVNKMLKYKYINKNNNRIIIVRFKANIPPYLRGGILI